MTLAESIQGFRLRVLREAVRSGNVAETCRRYEVSRTLFYRWRQRFQAYGADGVVDVGNAAEHGAEVETGAMPAERIPGASEAQAVLEGDDRRSGRHFGRPAQDLGAVDDVHPHDRELAVGQLVGLVEDLAGRAHLADVVHQSRQAELAKR